MRQRAVPVHCVGRRHGSRLRSRVECAEHAYSRPPGSGHVSVRSLAQENRPATEGMLVHRRVPEQFELDHRQPGRLRAPVFTRDGQRAQRDRLSHTHHVLGGQQKEPQVVRRNEIGRRVLVWPANERPATGSVQGIVILKLSTWFSNRLTNVSLTGRRWATMYENH